MSQTPEDVLDFWFREIGPDQWFDPNPTYDALMRERFAVLQDSAAREELPAWKKTPEGMLSLVLLLHEFPRRMYRGTARAFATDDLAMELAREAIIHHFDDRIDKTYKLIFYLPYMDSEDIADQRLALFYIRERTKDELWLKIAEDNFNRIERFGRFPARNAPLNRVSTPEEQTYLNQALRA